MLLLLLSLNLELFESSEVERKTFIVFGRRERLFDRRRTLIVTWVYIREKTINMGEHVGDCVEYGIVRRLVVGLYPSLVVVGVHVFSRSPIP